MVTIIIIIRCKFSSFSWVGQESTRGEVNRRLRLGDYTTILTEPEVNNCFSLYTRSDLNRIRKKAMKKKKKKTLV